MTIKFIKFSQLLRFVRPLFLILTLFQFISLNARRNSHPENNTPNIVILNSAKVYSADAGFNTQISFVHLSPADSDHPYLVKKCSTRNLQEVIQQPLQLRPSGNTDVTSTKTIKKKSVEAKRKAQKLRKSYQGFGFLKLYHLPSRDLFSHSDSFSTDYISPVQNCYDHCKPGIYQCHVHIKTALDHLHSKNKHYHDNKSFDFCYVTVYSVRPPPAFQSI